MFTSKLHLIDKLDLRGDTQEIFSFRILTFVWLASAFGCYSRKRIITVYYNLGGQSLDGVFSQVSNQSAKRTSHPSAEVEGCYQLMVSLVQYGAGSSYVSRSRPPIVHQTCWDAPIMGDAWYTQQVASSKRTSISNRI